SSPVSSWNQTTPLPSIVGAPSFTPTGCSVTRLRRPVDRSSAWSCQTPVSFDANVTRWGACGDHSGMATMGERNRRSHRDDSTAGSLAAPGDVSGGGDRGGHRGAFPAHLDAGPEVGGPAERLGEHRRQVLGPERPERL